MSKEYSFNLHYGVCVSSDDYNTYCRFIPEGTCDPDKIETLLAEELYCEVDDPGFDTGSTEVTIPEAIIAHIKFDAQKEYVERKGVTPSAPGEDLTKEDLRDQLLLGRTLGELLPVRDGQECEIVKVERYMPGEAVIYMPDLWMRNIPVNDPITDLEMLDEVIDLCYTGDDFLVECNDDPVKAERLFNYVDWQSPSSAVDELDD